MGVCLPARAEPPAPAKPAPGSVQVMFLPPPLEAGAVYSVGVYDAATGRLVRRLHEDAEDGAFSAGLNGFITFWDRRDDAGKTVPAGRYAARGWAVGEMRVEGVEILGNDWAAEDENLRITRVSTLDLVLNDQGLAIVGETTAGRGELARFSGKDGALVWHQPVARSAAFVQGDEANILYSNADGLVVYDLDAGRERSRLNLQSDLSARPRHGWTEGEAGTWWVVIPKGLFQLRGEDFGRVAKSPEDQMDADAIPRVALRALLTEPDQPLPRMVRTSRRGTRLYLLEESPGWQRVRGLEWSDTKPDSSGRPVSEWRTFFERNIRRPDPALGLDEHAPSPVVELPLAKNPLEPGKPQRARLRAGFDAHGSYLETADGLRLLPVSTRPNLRAAHLKRDPKDASRLLFYQFDGAAWDVFSLTGVPGALVGFDAGEFELTADGERHPLPPTEEPRDP